MTGTVDAPIDRHPTSGLQVRRRRRGARQRHALRDPRGVPARDPARDPPRDRSHPPDPRAHGRHQAPLRRRPHLRRRPDAVEQAPGARAAVAARRTPVLRATRTTVAGWSSRAPTPPTCSGALDTIAGPVVSACRTSTATTSRVPRAGSARGSGIADRAPARRLSTAPVAWTRSGLRGLDDRFARRGPLAFVRDVPQLGFLLIGAVSSPAPSPSSRRRRVATGRSRAPRSSRSDRSGATRRSSPRPRSAPRSAIAPRPTSPWPAAAWPRRVGDADGRRLAPGQPDAPTRRPSTAGRAARPATRCSGSTCAPAPPAAGGRAAARRDHRGPAAGHCARLPTAARRPSPRRRPTRATSTRSSSTTPDEQMLQGPVRRLRPHSRPSRPAQYRASCACVLRRRGVRDPPRSCRARTTGPGARRRGGGQGQRPRGRPGAAAAPRGDRPGAEAQRSWRPR